MFETRKPDNWLDRSKKFVQKQRKQLVKGNKYNEDAVSYLRVRLPEVWPVLENYDSMRQTLLQFSSEENDLPYQ